ncbi:hypothetical protein [Xanthobacter flavus]|uniref:hypothetical protein n=1 Tax=Xanthobacter flavus TaxID=281 RepID=UPI003729122D
MADDFDEDADRDLSAYRMISWRGNGARLKNYTTATKMGAPGIIKIEIETFDTYTMDDLIRDLKQIEDRQKKAAQAKKTTSKVVKKIQKPTPLLQLTYRGGE